MYARTGRGRNSTGLPVTDRAGRTIGRIIGRAYHKQVVREDQMLRSPPGFGFDAWAMDQLVLPRVDQLVVNCRFNGRTFSVSTETFRRYRLEINRGAGPQYVLPLGYWQEPDAATAPQPEAAASPAPEAIPVPVPPAAPPPAAAPAQGRLF